MESKQQLHFLRSAGVVALMIGCIAFGYFLHGGAPSGPTAVPVPVTPSAPKKPLSLTPLQIAQAKEKAQKQKVLEKKAAAEAKKAQLKAERERAQEIKEQARAEAEEQREQEAEQQRQVAAEQLDREAYATIKAKVQHDYPSDYITQKGVYDMAVDAYNYMKTVPDQEIKAKVVGDYPDDYITQKGVYDMAVKAKTEMQ